MNTPEQEVQTVDNSYWVEKWEALQRLYDNKDFQSVIMEGYFKDLAVNQTSMLAQPHTRASGTRPELMEVLVAISNLEYHLQMIENLGTIPDEYDDESEM